MTLPLLAFHPNGTSPPVPPSPVSPLRSTDPMSSLQSLQRSWPAGGRWAASVMQLAFAVRLGLSWYIVYITNNTLTQCTTVMGYETMNVLLKVLSWVWVGKSYIKYSPGFLVRLAAWPFLVGISHSSAPSWRHRTGKVVRHSTLPHYWCPSATKNLNWNLGSEGVVERIF